VTLMAMSALIGTLGAGEAQAGVERRRRPTC
jgi:hypothetical protein